MYKIIVLTVTIAGFLFAGSWDANSTAINKSVTVNNHFCLAEDTSKEDYKLERKRRGNRGDKKRRRGGNGLR
tara:strand:- start:222 stop:437 length:216 start_codon:yes stop_codon:yes gene_type:complete